MRSRRCVKERPQPVKTDESRGPGPPVWHIIGAGERTEELEVHTPDPSELVAYAEEIAWELERAGVTP